MEELTLTKLECSRRQLETAIKLFFEDGDTVSIHTLTCAAYNVIRDINNSRNCTPMFVKQRYVQMAGKPPLRDFNKPENFFKHADYDPYNKLSFYPKSTESYLVDACEKYRELTGERIPEFFEFTLWFISKAPEKFVIPEGWESFVDDTKELHAKNDRKGFHDRWIAHLSDLHEKGIYQIGEPE